MPEPLREAINEAVGKYLKETLQTGGPVDVPDMAHEMAQSLIDMVMEQDEQHQAPLSAWGGISAAAWTYPDRTARPLGRLLIKDGHPLLRQTRSAVTSAMTLSEEKAGITRTVRFGSQATRRLEFVMSTSFTKSGPPHVRSPAVGSPDAQRLPGSAPNVPR
jgi:hypothetical protein